MRCLYCGNELALLRKLTGYGEFCSEAHRQKYQEQYNRLALTRLLQAQDAEPARPPLTSPLRATLRNGGSIGAGKARKEIDAPGAAEAVRPPAPKPATPSSPATPPPISPAARPAGSVEPDAPVPGFIKPAMRPAPPPAALRGNQPELVITPVSVTDTLVSEALRPVPPGWVLAPESPAQTQLPVHAVAEPGPGALTPPIRGSQPMVLELAKVEAVPGVFGTPEAFAWPPAAYINTLAGSLDLIEPAKAEPVPEPPPVVKPAQAEPPAAAPKHAEVVINWAALGLSDDEPAPVAKPVSAPVAEAIPEPVAVAVVPEPAPALCKMPDLPVPPLAAVAAEPVEMAVFQPPVFDITTPALSALPLRPKFVFGPSPVEAKGPAAEPPKPAPAVPPVVPPAVPPAATSDQPPAEPWRKRTPLPESHAPEKRPPVVVPRPAAKPETPKVEVPPAAPKPEAPKPEAAKPEAAKPVTPKPETPKPAAAEAPKAKPASQKTGRQSARLGGPSLDRGRRRMDDASGIDSLREEMERQSGAGPDRSRATARRSAVAAAIVVLVALVAWALWHEAVTAKAGSAPKGAVKGATRVEVTSGNLIEGEGGWRADLAGEASNEMLGRSVYIYDRSRTMTDYRYEFEGAIKKKGLGWLFRAQNPRNYYAMRLELLKTGADADAVLIRTAVINGEETQKTTIPLPGPVREDTRFQVRTDVLGSTFRTYIQGNLVDTWVEDRLKVGAVGLWKNQDEDCDVRLIQLHKLEAAGN